MTQLPYFLSNTAGTSRLVLNTTFMITDHDSQLGWGISQTPRSHGDRAQDVAYVNGKSMGLRGFLGAGMLGGSLPFGWVMVNPIDSTVQPVGGINASVVTIPLVSAAGFARAGRILIDSEAITYTGITVNSLTGATRGVDGTTAVPHAQGAVVYAPDPDQQFLDALHTTYAWMHTHKRVLFDYRNGWFQYGLFESLKSKQAEGWPDLRAVEIALHCEDPLAYALAPIVAERIGSVLRVVMGGNAPTNHFRLQVRSATTSEQVVKIYHTQTQTSMLLTLPKVSDPPLVLNGWQRQIYQIAISNPVWSRYGAGGVLPILQPGLNTLVFSDPSTNTATQLTTLTDSTHTGSPNFLTVQAEMTTHSAVWMADSLKAPGNLPPGLYDLSAYDVDVYG